VKRLLHCVFRSETTHSQVECGPEVSVISSRGLAVATSPWPDGGPVPGSAHLRAYERVIANLHASRTVIPLRFGCVVEGRPRIVRLLDEHSAEFDQVLARVDGAAEMGLRLWRESNERARPDATGPGARYLADARSRHAVLTSNEDEWAGRIRRALEGLYVGQRTEARPAGDGRLISLHIQVARGSTDDFRDRVRRLTIAEDMKLLLSGPWPPYHFVDYV